MYWVIFDVIPQTTNWGALQIQPAVCTAAVHASQNRVVGSSTINGVHCTCAYAVMWCMDRYPGSNVKYFPVLLSAVVVVCFIRLDGALEKCQILVQCSSVCKHVEPAVSMIHIIRQTLSSNLIYVHMDNTIHHLQPKNIDYRYRVTNSRIDYCYTRTPEYIYMICIYIYIYMKYIRSM